MIWLLWLITFQALAIFAAPLSPRDEEFCIDFQTITVTVTLPSNTDPVSESTSTQDPGNFGISHSGGIFFVPITTTTVTAQVSVYTASDSSGTVQVLPSLTSTTPGTGTVQTSLETSGYATSNPLLTSSISTPSTTLSAVSSLISVLDLSSAAMPSANIFAEPVATTSPSSKFPLQTDHPVARLGINQKAPIETNKFYANFFLGTQGSGTWTHPYSVTWAKGTGSSSSWGLAVSHIDANQFADGPNATADPVQYFINPIGIQSLVLSAAELGSSTVLTTDSLTDSSINVNLAASSGASPAVTFPLVQGMGFVTGIYNGSTPLVQSGVFFRTVTKVATSPKTGITKYNLLLEDGKTWLMYAYSETGAEVDFTAVNNSLLQATADLYGFIQVAKAPNSAAEALYDQACGVYPTTMTLSGSVAGSAGTYSFTYSKAGLTASPLLMWALPHHIESFSTVTSELVANAVQLQTTTKGNATAVLADVWTLVEPDMPTDLSFAPWRPDGNTTSSLSADTLATIQAVAESEVSQDMNAQTDLNSMYYSGKALAKFAGIVWSINDVLKDSALATAGLQQLEAAFAVFANNTQDYPLYYESAWGGIVSSASYTTGDSGADFGNTYYNDHHFHYGYFIYTAAVLGYLDSNWLASNKDYVNTLVRDIANPTTEDTYFPVYRMFDWYHGHGWAHGLYEVADGKDEESSSEDSMHAYALKMWGKVTGDANMEARGNLQLALNARSLQNYFLYQSNNTVEPANFIGNKVSGILFENKIDHTTYFGTNIEYIEGIHMLPLLPESTLTRTQTFVSEEWDTYFADGYADTVSGGWRGILYANLAIIDPVTAYNFFSQADFDSSWLDGGASQTWYLVWSAMLGGAS